MTKGEGKPCLGHSYDFNWQRPQGAQLPAPHHQPPVPPSLQEKLGSGSWLSPFLPYTLGTEGFGVIAVTIRIGGSPILTNVRGALRSGGGSLPPTNTRKLGHQLLLPSQPFLLRPKIAQPDGGPQGARSSVDPGKPPTHCQRPYSSLALPCLPAPWDALSPR